MARTNHTLSSDLLRRPIRILVVGAGGTGSSIVMGLPYLDQAMRAWGHAHGIEVYLMDADTVSDIGHNKATVLINRINLFWGTRWSAVPKHFHEGTLEQSQDRNIDLLIGCVDSEADSGAPWYYLEDQ